MPSSARLLSGIPASRSGPLGCDASLMLFSRWRSVYERDCQSRRAADTRDTVSAGSATDGRRTGMSAAESALPLRKVALCRLLIGSGGLRLDEQRDDLRV